MSMTGVRVYGADWCRDSLATRNHLDSLGVQYEYVNVDTDEQALHWVEQHNGGRRRLPTIDLAGQVIAQPSERDLELALRGKGLMS